MLLKSHLARPNPKQANASWMRLLVLLSPSLHLPRSSCQRTRCDVRASSTWPLQPLPPCCKERMLSVAFPCNRSSSSSDNESSNLVSSQSRPVWQGAVGLHQSLILSSWPPQLRMPCSAARLQLAPHRTRLPLAHLLLRLKQVQRRQGSPSLRRQCHRHAHPYQELLP